MAATECLLWMAVMTIRKSLFFSVMLTSYVQLAFAQPSDALKGMIETSPISGASWISLEKLRDFHAGDVLIVHLQDNAAKCMLARLLSDTDDARLRIGVVQGIDYIDESNLTISVTIDRDYHEIRQISIHGRNPWGQYLCSNNGTPTIKAIDYIPLNAEVTKAH